MEGNYLYNHVSKCIAIKLVIRMTIFIYFYMGLFIFEKREYRAQGQTQDFWKVGSYVQMFWSSLFLFSLILPNIP